MGFCFTVVSHTFLSFEGRCVYCHGGLHYLPHLWVSLSEQCLNKLEPCVNRRAFSYFVNATNEKWSESHWRERLKSARWGDFRLKCTQCSVFVWVELRGSDSRWEGKEGGRREKHMGNDMQHNVQWQDWTANISKCLNCTCRPMTHCPAFIFSSSNILSCLSAYFTPMSTRDWQPLVLAWWEQRVEGSSLWKSKNPVRHNNSCSSLSFVACGNAHQALRCNKLYEIYSFCDGFRLTMLARASSVVWTCVMFPFSNRSLASKISWGFRPYVVVALIKLVRFSSLKKKTHQFKLNYLDKNSTIWAGFKKKEVRSFLCLHSILSCPINKTQSCTYKTMLANHCIYCDLVWVSKETSFNKCSKAIVAKAQLKELTTLPKYKYNHDLAWRMLKAQHDSTRSCLVTTYKNTSLMPCTVIIRCATHKKNQNNKMMSSLCNYHDFTTPSISWNANSPDASSALTCWSSSLSPVEACW